MFDKAGLENDATFEKWPQVLEQLVDLQVRLITDSAELRSIFVELRGARIHFGQPGKAEPRLHFGERSDAFTLATGMASDSADRSALARARRDAAAAGSVSQAGAPHLGLQAKFRGEYADTNANEAEHASQ